MTRGLATCVASVLVSIVLAMLASLVPTGCARREARESSAGSCSCDDTSPGPVDAKLMAWLSKARTLHHLADLGETEGALDRAITPLEELVSGPVPAGPSPEVDEVLADTHARLAELRVRRGDLDGAEADVVKGLEHAPGRTYFRGHLLEMRGLVFEKMSESLAKAGKAAQAEEARQKAMRASLEAVRLQDEVITGALGDGGAPNPGHGERLAPAPKKRD